MSYVSLSEDVVDRASAELDAIRLQIVVIPSHAADSAHRVQGLIGRCDRTLAKLVDALTDPALKSSRDAVEKLGQYEALAKRHRRLVAANRNLKEQLVKKAERIANQGEKLKQQREQVRSAKAAEKAASKELRVANNTIGEHTKRIEHLETEVAWQKAEIERLQDEINTAAWKDEVGRPHGSQKGGSAAVTKVKAKGR